MVCSMTMYNLRGSWRATENHSSFLPRCVSSRAAEQSVASYSILVSSNFQVDQLQDPIRDQFRQVLKYTSYVLENNTRDCTFVSQLRRFTISDRDRWEPHESSWIPPRGCPMRRSITSKQLEVLRIFSEKRVSQEQRKQSFLGIMA